MRLMHALSIVIPTHNRGALLERCVLSVLSASSATAEILVSDDGSSDDSRERMETLAARYPNVTWLSASRTGPAGARNRGWRAARGDIIAFIDDDCVAAPRWTDELEAPLLRDTSLAGVEGQTRPERPARSFFEHSINSSGGAFLSCNIAFRKSVLEQVGGFDEGFPFPHGEDIDLGYRLLARDARIAYQPSALVFHAVTRIGPAYYMRRTRMDPSSYRLFVRNPACFQKALRTVRLARVLDTNGRQPGFGRILAFLVASRIFHAYFCLRDGTSLRERLIGCLTHLTCLLLSVRFVPASLAAYRAAASGSQTRASPNET